jgi:hypothetical protein
MRTYPLEEFIDIYPNPSSNPRHAPSLETIAMIHAETKDACMRARFFYTSLHHQNVCPGRQLTSRRAPRLF